MKEKVLEYFEDSAGLKIKFGRNNWKKIISSAQIIASAMRKGNKVLLFGNGGSAADAQHIAAEFVNRFQRERRPLPAIALTTDTSILTSIANDYDFDEVFAKQIEALGKKGDVAFGITTSGESQNIIKGLEQAGRMGLKRIALLGRNGGRAKKRAEVALVVKSNETPKIQETHITVCHVLCILVDDILFGRRK